MMFCGVQEREALKSPCAPALSKLLNAIHHCYRQSVAN